MAANQIRDAFFKMLPVVPVAIAFNDLVGSVAVVHGRSMQPTLNPLLEDESSLWAISDRVVLDKMSVRLKKVKKGDIVVLKSPTNPHERCVKRLVGSEGEWIRAKDDRPVFVPAGYCWVEGDSQKFSTDSNDYGPVPLALLEAKVVAVMWPPSRVSQLDGPIAPPAKKVPNAPSVSPEPETE
jgi:inner membrane protease subunit 2